MASSGFSAPRLFVQADLAVGVDVEIERSQAHYLLNVLRFGTGDPVLAFNGRDGEWRCEVRPEGRKAATLTPLERTRAQPERARLDYLFAPLKHARLDYVVQKAVEMGAGRLAPVITRRTVATRVNLERMAANAVEAAEQCGILELPEIVPDADLPTALGALAPGTLLVFCDEDAPLGDPVAALAGRRPGPGGLALLVGPEGGFDPAERALVLARQDVLRLSLGPRILRADTAAIAALALVQATLGDWR